MKFHNTLSRQPETFTPQVPGEVTLYTCGPTVYNAAHIGNLRSFVFDDTLRRTLETQYIVRHVMNITDVGHLVGDGDDGEDKLQSGAHREGLTVWDVAHRYTDAFKDDMASLNVLVPNAYDDAEAGDTYARATRFIDGQIALVTLLVDKGFAYQTKQAIYFEVAKDKHYGALTGQDLGDKEVGARTEVVTDPDKRGAHDFAVWFFTVGRYVDHSMHWPSPWGEGFPGWHLECSAIIHATLGDPIDIHTGGVDHIGTHHPNEIAQTHAAYGHPLARVWMHNEFVLEDGAKMSKSAGSFLTLGQLKSQGFHPLSFRLMCLQAHYRSQLNFSLEALEASQKTLMNLYAWADLRHQPNLSDIQVSPHDLEKFLGRVQGCLADDLATPRALAELFGYTLSLAPGMRYDDEDADFLLSRLDAMLGLDLNGRVDIDEVPKAIIAERQAARDVRDWARADVLRAKLRKLGLDVDDTPNGPRWRRITLT